MSFKDSAIRLYGIINAEPLGRYKEGGYRYHPIHLGDVLNERRYRILHQVDGVVIERCELPEI